MSSKRERLTIGIDPDIAALLKEVREQGLIGLHGNTVFFRAAIVSALQSALNVQEGSPEKREAQAPPFLEAPQPLSDFLSAARGEITMFGITLASLHEEGVVEALETRISRGRVAMHFVLLDPKALGVYDSLNQRRAKDELDQTYSVLFKLQELGLREQAEVNIRRTMEMPSMGIVITDPLTDVMRARVEHFSDPYYRTKPHPFFQVDWTTGREMCNRLFAYYMSFLPGCGRVVSFIP